MNWSFFSSGGGSSTPGLLAKDSLCYETLSNQALTAGGDTTIWTVPSNKVRVLTKVSFNREGGSSGAVLPKLTKASIDYPMTSITVGINAQISVDIKPFLFVEGDIFKITDLGTATSLVGSFEYIEFDADDTSGNFDGFQSVISGTGTTTLYTATQDDIGSQNPFFIYSNDNDLAAVNALKEDGTFSVALHVVPDGESADQGNKVTTTTGPSNNAVSQLCSNNNSFNLSNTETLVLNTTAWSGNNKIVAGFVTKG